MQQEQWNKKKDLFTDEGGSYYLFILQNKWHNELLNLLTFLHIKPKIELKFKSTILLILSIQSEAEWAFFCLNLQYKSFIGRSSCFWRPLLAVCDKKKISIDVGCCMKRCNCWLFCNFSPKSVQICKVWCIWLWVFIIRSRWKHLPPHWAISG